MSVIDNNKRAKSNNYFCKISHRENNTTNRLELRVRKKEENVGKNRHKVAQNKREKNNGKNGN